MRILSSLLFVLFILSANIMAFAESRRDPFVPLLPEEKKEDKLSNLSRAIQRRKPVYARKDIAKDTGISLEGVVWVDKTPQAIINNKVYKVGDSLGEGVRITRIEKDEVYVYYKDRIYIFTMRKESVKLEVK